MLIRGIHDKKASFENYLAKELQAKGLEFVSSTPCTGFTVKLYGGYMLSAINRAMLSLIDLSMLVAVAQSFAVVLEFPAA